MRRSRSLALCAVAASATAMSAFAQPAFATARPSAQAAAPVAWSAAHGDATASGTRWTESGTPFPSLKIEGTLEKTGTGCSSLWVQWTFDLVTGPPQKVGSQCGSGSESVATSLQTYMPTTTGRVAVCEGEDGTSDCGAWESVTTWPAGREG
ncbi:hypothetical protein GCM10012287_54830 [Streptomyces daqingensis]|uniref:Secreted protein n=1 Tax=Streptomyces daqingensis TaxID=1472640 RepID=A0ABQ2MTU1_9ACTN|nr:hypothetical protein [Streptomyces daqingensis]GGO57906.1 hypothetical protein GCM10012287_54830 [Streptomyces daqingensis]